METKKFNIAPYRKSMSVIEQKANILSIKTESDIKSASDVLFQIKSFAKRIKEEKEKITKPLNEALKNTRGIFSPIEAQCQNAEYTIKDKMLKFNEKKEAEAQKKLEKLTNKIAEGKIDLEEASEKADSLQAEKSYQGEDSSVQFRNQKVIVITDEAKIPREYLMPDMAKIKEDAFKGVSIAGIEVKIEKIVASGRI